MTLVASTAVFWANQKTYILNFKPCFAHLQVLQVYMPSALLLTTQTHFISWLAIPLAICSYTEVGTDLR